MSANGEMFGAIGLNKLSELEEKVKAMENKVNLQYTKIQNLQGMTQSQGALLAGDSSPFGTGYMGDVVIDDSFTFPANDVYGRCIVQCKSFTLPAGVTLNVPECAGFYILSQGDITINGTLKSQNNVVVPNENAVNYFELNGNKYYFANGGTTRNYNGTITQNKSYFSTTFTVGSDQDDDHLTKSTFGGITDTGTAISNVNKTHFGGYPYDLRGVHITCKYNNTDKSIGSYANATIDDQSIDSNISSLYNKQELNIKSSASIILIASGGIYNNGIIDTRGTIGESTFIDSTVPTSNNFTTYISGYYYGINFKIPGSRSTKILPPTASGGITIISNFFTNNNTLLTNGTNLKIESVSIDNAYLTSSGEINDYKPYVTYVVSNSSYYGGYSQLSDTIITTPGEIKVYKLGGES